MTSPVDSMTVLPSVSCRSCGVGLILEDTLKTIPAVIEVQCPVCNEIKSYQDFEVQSKKINFITRFAADENGAALMEYTVLLGVLVVAVVAVIATMGDWIQTQWSAVCNSIIDPKNNGVHNPCRVSH